MILDEPTSSLDVSIQTQILDLLNDLQQKNNLSYIFISHDMKVIQAVSDYIIVIKNGNIVEEGKTDAIFNRSQTAVHKKFIASNCIKNFRKVT